MGWKRSENIPKHSSRVQQRQYKTMLDTLENWTKHKSDEIVAFTHLRTLNQGNKILSTYIQEVRRAADLCNFSCAGDCNDRLIRNSIIAGLLSTKAYQQCILKGSSLSLNECIKLCQMEDATCGQVKPYAQNLQTVQKTHPSTKYPNTHSNEASQTTEAEDPSGVADPTTEASWPWEPGPSGVADQAAGAAQVQEPGPRETTDTAPRLHVNSVAQTPTSLGKNAQPSMKSVIIVKGLSTSQKYTEEIQTTATKLKSTT